jgi:hypothetical protein
MYQKGILPYYNSLLSHPKLLPLWSDRRTDRRTDNILHPLLPKFFFFPTECTGPYPQAQLYWAGQLWGEWPIELDLDSIAICILLMRRASGKYVTVLKSYILGFLYVEIAKIAVT